VTQSQSNQANQDFKKVIHQSIFYRHLLAQIVPRASVVLYLDLKFDAVIYTES
jgi:lipopolysaccharide biosynthesis glycosyltransferase